jgi:hypothetical protein
VLGGLTEAFVNADVECDAAILFIVFNIVEDFFDVLLLRARIDVSVSHVTDIVLKVAEFERCGRDLRVLVFSFRGLLVFPVPILARATCSGTT